MHPPGGVRGVLHHQLAPGIDVGRIGPARIELVDVQLEVDVGVLEQVEQEQRRIGLRKRGQVGHRARPGDSGIDLAQVQVVGVLVMQEVEFEVAPVAHLPEFLAEGDGRLRGPRSRTLRGKAAAFTSLPHHPPRYGVNSLKPISSVISGPTMVPCRVTQASSAEPRTWTRFITLTSGSAVISSACFF